MSHRIFSHRIPTLLASENNNPTHQTKTMFNKLINSSAGPLLRHGLTVLSGYLAASGLPGLSDGTVGNITEVVLSAASLGLALARNYAEKAIRPVKK